jgi:hypothetical protein
MKRHLPLAPLIVLAFSSVCLAQTQATASPSPSPKPKPAMTKAQMLKKLSAMETKLWEAWKNKDTKPFQATLASDSIMVGDSGTSGKTNAIKELESMACDVKSYSLSDWKLTMINSSAALLTYKGTQDATCGGTTSPPAVWASSIWVNRGGKWLAFSHQETPAK